MGTWNVDPYSEPGILHLKLTGRMSDDEMGAFVKAHNSAIDEYRRRDYRVFCDISEMSPLSPTAAALLEQAKRYSNSHANFRGSAVLVSSATVALQHRRTSIDGGVMPTELISPDLQALRAHLKAVDRR
jgi:hypothetical protein